LNENQWFLFAAEILSQEKKDFQPKDEPQSNPPKRKGHGRKRLPKSLKRQRVVFDLANHENVADLYAFVSKQSINLPVNVPNSRGYKISNPPL
jgi:hypothetical protein